MSVSVETSNHQRHHTDSLLAEVFSVVQLPPVRSDQVHESTNRAEQDAILAELDQVLQKQRSLSESSSSTAHSQGTLRNHEPEQHLYDDVASLKHPHDEEENHYASIPDYTSNHNVQGSVRDDRSNSLASEEADVFPMDGNAIQAEIASLRRVSVRQRSQTIDSQVSTAESRFGGFDVQDENGRYKGSQINLFHDEVAYLRPKKWLKKGVSESESISSNKPQQTHHEPTPLATPRQSFQSARPPTIPEHKTRTISDSKSRNSSILSQPAVLPPTFGAKSRNSSILSQAALFDGAKSRNSSILSQQTVVKAPSEHRGSVQLNGQGNVTPTVEARQVTTRSGSNGSALKSEKSLLDNPVEFNETVVEHLERGTLLHEVNGYGIIQPYFSEFYHEKFRHLVVGDREKCSAERKVIMLVGESGIGKTTFVYSALNYLYGVEKDYDFRFAIESPDDIQPTKGRINLYTLQQTILGQDISFVDTPGIDREGSLELIQEWIKHRLDKKPQLKLDALVVFRKQNDRASNPKLTARLRKLEQLLGGDIRTMTIPACTFANYATETDIARVFSSLPFPVDGCLLFNNAGFFPNTPSLQQLVNFKTSCSSFDELFFALNYKTHPVVLARRKHDQA